MNMKRFLSIFFVLPLVFVSCDLTMDEVSQDVNKPTQVHPKTILTQLCITTFGIEYYGVQPYRLAWQWDQRGGGGHFNFQRRNFISEYRRVTWCYDMIREAERLNDPRYIHLAAYFRASWIFDTTRLFGDVPYTEAAQGRFDDPNFSPKYDPQEEIVAGLLRELAAANEALGDYDNTKIDRVFPVHLPRSADVRLFYCQRLRLPQALHQQVHPPAAQKPAQALLLHCGVHHGAALHHSL